jgi:tetratricopeptide (TPR) repeat protein
MSRNAGVTFPRPTDWQLFERQVRELFACELGDPQTQLHGRLGQSQSGVDIYGYRGNDKARLVGVQCKLSSESISITTLLREVRRVESFVPPVTEFILATTAPRNAKLQESVRLLNQATLPNRPAFSVSVWGWEDLVEAAVKYEAASQAFDPTWNPFAQRAHEKTTAGLIAIDRRLAAIQASLPSGDKTVSNRRVVELGRLPDIAYINLVGRETELKCLDDAWYDEATRILSLTSFGGVGKTAVVNEWLKEFQLRGYGGAGAVLGWSFYDQGTKERSSSAEPFLDWALKQLEITADHRQSTAKGELLAEAVSRRNVLLILDGLEPLQHGPGPHSGELRDLGLRAFLRRLAMVAASKNGNGLVIITSRLAVRDLVRWTGGSSRNLLLDKLSDDAGAALLRDNGVRGSDDQMRLTSRAFHGHALALTLLSSLITELFAGDVRQRDRVRELLSDAEVPGHDHAWRVLESIDKEWLSKEPALRQIMCLVGLFNQPASIDSLKALTRKPPIIGFNDNVMTVGDRAWQHAIARLREVRLLLPQDNASPSNLDVHPLVREWFSTALHSKDESAWRAGHGMLYEHFRRTTHEGVEPTLEDLLPLYQAVGHGCQAGNQFDALQRVYWNRIERRTPTGRLMGYAWKKLGAAASNLLAIAWFFERPFEQVSPNIPQPHHPWLFNAAAVMLRAQGRFEESILAQTRALAGDEAMQSSLNAGISAANLGEIHFALGNLAAAAEAAERSVAHTKKSGVQEYTWIHMTGLAEVLTAAGDYDSARAIFHDVERQCGGFLGSIQGYRICDFFLLQREWREAFSRIETTFKHTKSRGFGQDIALGLLIQSRVATYAALEGAKDHPLSEAPHEIMAIIENAIEHLRRDAFVERLPLGYLARCSLGRLLGDWDAVARDHEELDDLTRHDGMQLFQCDLALERTKAALSQLEGYAPLAYHGVDVAFAGKRGHRQAEAHQHLAVAEKIARVCGYRKRSLEIKELKSVLQGVMRMADISHHI